MGSDDKGKVTKEVVLAEDCAEVDVKRPTPRVSNLHAHSPNSLLLKLCTSVPLVGASHRTSSFRHV